MTTTPTTAGQAFSLLGGFTDALKAFAGRFGWLVPSSMPLIQLAIESLEMADTPVTPVVRMGDRVTATSPEYAEEHTGIVTQLENELGHAIWVGVTDSSGRMRAFKLGPSSPDQVKVLHDRT